MEFRKLIEVNVIPAPNKTTIELVVLTDEGVSLMLTRDQKSTSNFKQRDIS